MMAQTLDGVKSSFARKVSQGSKNTPRWYVGVEEGLRKKVLYCKWIS